MDPEELDDLGFEEEPPSPDIPRGTSLPAGALVLPRVDVAGMADGTGSSTWSDAPTTRKRAQSPITPEVRDRQLDQEARAAGSRGDMALDAVQAFTGLGSRMGRQESLDARARTGRRAEAAAERFRSDPMGTTGAALYGPASGATSGLLDELGGLVGAGMMEVQRAIPGGAEPPDMSAGDITAEIRQGRDRLRGRAPEVMAAGEVAGEAAQMAIPPMRGAGPLARVATAGAEGALYGAAHSVGYGDPTSGSEALDMGAEGAGIGGLVGMGLGGAGEATRAALRRLADTSRTSRALDDATLAAPRQAGGGISQATARYERGTSPAARERTRRAAAESLREADAIPLAGTTGQTLERIQAARQRGFATLEGIASDMGERGATGTAVAERLRSAAAEDTSAMGSQFRDIATDMADRIAERYGDSPVVYSQLMQELSRLRDLGAYQTRAGREVSMPREAMGETYDALRGSYDDAVEGALGPDRLAEFQGARRRETALRVAEELGREGTARESERRAIGLTEMAAYGAGQGGAEALGLPAGAGPLLGAGMALGASVLRAREPRIRYAAALSADRMARFLQTPRAQQLGRFADELRQHLQRGPASLGAAMYVLSQRDAEFRELMDTIDFEDDPYAETPAMGAISESADGAGETP